MEELLKEKGLKLTRQRLLVLNIINNLGDNATLTSIVDSCENINKSTVYRILGLFINMNILEKSININKKIYYTIKEQHTHYLICVNCHKKEKIKLCPLENDIKEIENKQQFKVLNHIIQFYGICKKCQKRR